MQVCTSLQTNNHASTSPLSFLQAGCPSCRPTNSVKALKATMPLLMPLIPILIILSLLSSSLLTLTYKVSVFSAMTLLVGRQEEQRHAKIE